MMNRDIVILDLFSGIGGFSAGFQRAGYNIKKHYFSEIDKHAIAVYKHNFKNSEYVGSVTDVRGGELPERPNVITFGSPCQDFSLAGKRKGMEGERSSLILHAIRLIEECKPDVFIWENVKGAFSSNNGADFWAIIQAFADIGGYRLEWQLLNTAWFLPQNRERIYLVGHLAGGSTRNVFPFGEELTRAFEGTKQTANTFTAGGHSEGMHSNMTLIKSATNLGYEVAEPEDSINLSQPNSETSCNQAVILDCYNNKIKEDICGTITQHCGRNGMTNGMKVIPVSTPTRIKKTQDGKTNTLTGVEKDNIVIQLNQSKESGGKQPYQQNRVYAKEGISTALDQAAGRWSVNTEPNIRRLTEIECERLQGFPDDWTKYGNYDGEVKEVSKTQRYKQLGNAVTVDVVAEIARRL